MASYSLNHFNPLVFSCLLPVWGHAEGLVCVHLRPLFLISREIAGNCCRIMRLLAGHGCGLLDRNEFDVSHASISFVKGLPSHAQHIIALATTLAAESAHGLRRLFSYASLMNGFTDIITTVQ